MKQQEVKIGGTYVAKVSDHLVPVQIARESQYGGWEALNLKTGKTVRIKSAQRLRYACDKAGKMIVPEKKMPKAKAAPAAEAPATPPTAAPVATKEGDAPKDITAEPKAPKTPKAPKAPKADGKMSGLDAAAKVLGEAGEALGCKEIVKRAAEKGYWSSGRGEQVPQERPR